MLTEESKLSSVQKYGLDPGYYADIIDRINGMPDELVRLSGMTKQQVLDDDHVLTMMWFRYQRFMDEEDEESVGWGIRKKEQAFKTACADVLVIRPINCSDKKFNKLWNRTEQTYIEMAALIRITETFNKELRDALCGIYGKSDPAAKSVRTMANKIRDIRYGFDRYLERDLPDADHVEWMTAFTGPLNVTDPSRIEKAIKDRIDEILKTIDAG